MGDHTTEQLKAGAVSAATYRSQRDALLSIVKSVVECGYLPALPEPSLLTAAVRAIAKIEGAADETP